MSLIIMMMMMFLPKFFIVFAYDEKIKRTATLIFPIQMMVAFNKLLTLKHGILNTPSSVYVCFYLSQLRLSLRV